MRVTDTDSSLTHEKFYKIFSPLQLSVSANGSNQEQAVAKAQVYILCSTCVKK